MASLPASSTRFVTGAYLAFLLTRFYFYVCFSAAASDVEIYFRYALAGVDRGETAYREIREIEYPPVAFWAMCLPRQTMSTRFPEAEIPRADYLRELLDYDVRFRALMLACDVAAFAFFAAVVRRLRPDRLAICLWAYVICTSLLGYVLYERLDVGLNLALLGWMYGALRGDDGDRRGTVWSIFGDTLLGLGVSYKLIPIVIVPFALLRQASRWRKNYRDLSPLLGVFCLTAAALGPYLYYYVLVGDDLGRMFRYHAERGIEIESTYATWMMLTRAPGELSPYFDFGSWNLGGDAEAGLTKISTPLLAAALFLLGSKALVQTIRDRFDGRAACLAASAAIAVAVGTAKVFSVQYLCWTLPLVVAAAAVTLRKSKFVGVVAACIVSAALTGFIFPYHFVDGMYVYPYSKTSPPPWTLVCYPQPAMRNDRSIVVGKLSEYGPPWWAITIRNLLYAGCTAIVVGGVWRASALAREKT